MKYIQCRRCKGKNGKVGQPGYIQTFIENTDGTKTEAFIECECHKEWREQNRIEAEAKKAGLNPKWKDFDISKDYVGTSSINNVKRLQKYVDRFINEKDEKTLEALKSSCIYIYGPNGTQKTTIGNWIGYEMIRNHKKVRYFLMNDLIKLLLDNDFSNKENQEKIDKILDCDCLIIDESFDSDKVTIYQNSKFQFPFLDTFLRNRIQGKNKGIIFISNVKMEEIDSEKIKDKWGTEHQNKFASAKSIADLVNRNVKLCNGYMEFYDNYLSLRNEVNIRDLF